MGLTYKFDSHNQPLLCCDTNTFEYLCTFSFRSKAKEAGAHLAQHIPLFAVLGHNLAVLGNGS